MKRIRPKDTELLTKLSAFGKAYFSVADLERILGFSRESLYVTLNRLVKAGVLKRLRKNVYVIFNELVDTEKIANELYFPCYLSFKSALSYYGILSQVPYMLIFATVKPSKKMKIGNFEAEFRHLKEDLFFGYILKDGKNIAEPEKALLDELYMVVRGEGGLDIEELDLRDIDKNKLKEYAKKFPGYVNRLVEKVNSYLGTTPITNEYRERIYWGKKDKKYFKKAGFPA